LETDTWGRDPQVQYLRSLFTAIETAQRDLLERLGISLYDERLSRWRPATLKLFEKVWALSARRGASLDEKAIAEVYLHCLVTILGPQEMDIPWEGLPENKTIIHWIKEVQR
jgi:hypothetical protein